MKIAITGGTGFLGRPLGALFAAQGHEVVVLTRSLAPGVVEPTSNPRIMRAGWTPDGTASAWSRVLSGAGAIVNLAGESIAGRRWSSAQKERIRQSRVLATRSVVAALRETANPPRILVNGSAVGYYGDTGDRIVTEEDAAGRDFLAQLCVEWEREALQAESAAARVVMVRTGVVLAGDGGALAPLLPLFKMFVGGPLGPGKQYWSWIHRDDWLAMIAWAIKEAEAGAHGAYNATAPTPVTNRDFSTALGKALGRPSLLPAPAFALRIAVGEMADAMLLAGQRVVPERALGQGFRFKYADLEAALAAIVHST
jgi:uncharacterized protein (TIGR01777 family)